MPISRNTVDTTKFNRNAGLPYELRTQDFQLAMQDVYHFYSMLIRIYLGKDCRGLTICFVQPLCQGCSRTC